MSGCRIGKIKPRSGGEIYRLPIVERDEMQRAIVHGASMISGFYQPDEMAGYVVMGWAADGTYSIGYRLNDESPVKPTMLPSYVADALRRDLISNKDWD